MTWRAIGAEHVVAPGPGKATRPALTWLDGAGAARIRGLPAAGRLLIGRDTAADVALTWDAAVSRQHAAVAVVDGRVLLTDLGSRNGTFHNGERIEPGPTGAALRPGDILRCGDTVLAVTGPARSARSLSVQDDTRTAGR